MKSARVFMLIVLWLLAIVVSAVINYQIGIKQLSVAETPVRSHLKYSLHEFLFDDELGRNNDSNAIQYVGSQLNASLKGIIKGHWFSSYSSCDATLLQVDGIAIKSDFESGQILQTSISRNHTSRPVTAAIQCHYQATPIVVLATLLGLVFILLYKVLPAPLSNRQFEWISYLRARGYGKQQAYQLAEQCVAENLQLTAAQRACFDLLHEPGKHNFDKAIQVASDPRINSLDGLQIAWLAKVMEGDSASLEEGLALLALPDLIEIDLPQARLGIRGQDIELSKTSFFYYAWYAIKRLEGDGWLVNPQSNRPDPEEGKALAELMWKYGGHGRSISDLEEGGLKARGLDQNRSKIKDEFTEALGEELAEAYLFDADKDEASGRMRYRLTVQAEQIRLVY
jgi:hypothetical protein